MNLKKNYKTPELTTVVSVVDCLTLSGGGYDNVVKDVDWDTIETKTI